MVGENGGMLAIPEGDGWEVEVLGLPRDYILEEAHALREKHGYRFEGFSDWDVSGIVERTGLSEEAAARSGDRLTTEPILWEDEDERFEEFRSQLGEVGVRILRGGHFIHLMGEADKSEGLRAVQRYFADRAPETDWMTVALGDSANDEQMLRAAELGFALPGRSGGWVRTSVLQTQRIEKAGPEGWNEAILSLRSISEDHG